MTAVATSPYRLLAGPRFDDGAEGYADHVARLGEPPYGFAGPRLIESLERSGLLGRGGAGFPVGRKWRAVAERGRRGTVVIANGAEGEPRSAKDRALLTLRPHLVIDGAMLAALSVGAGVVRIYVGTEHRDAVHAVARAIAQRPRVRGISLALVEAPTGYVSGESSAVVRYLNERDARPSASPLRPSERGVGGRPTLVQNVESLAYAALIARHGAEWYRQAGRGTLRGTALVTITGPVREPGVREIEYGTTLREVIALGRGHAGWDGRRAAGRLLRWLGRRLRPPRHAARPRIAGGRRHRLRLWAGKPVSGGVLRGVGHGADRCLHGRRERRQCGPCIFGLGAMATSLRRLAAGGPERDDLVNLDRWSAELMGRGACHHPDGAAALLRSGLAVFADEFALHAGGRCSRPPRQAREMA